MKLAERHIIKKGHCFWFSCDNLARKSKNLYNACNYLIRHNFIYGHGYISYNQMAFMMKTTEEYKELPAKVSQQVLKGLDKNWISFFKANSEYKENPSKFKGRPSIPNYKDTKKGRNLVVYTKQALSKVSLDKGLVKLSGTNISLPSKFTNCVAEVRIVPKTDCYVIEVVYDQQETEQENNDYIAAIDLGLNNLMAVTSNQPGFIPLLINGRPLKSINQFFNKKKADLQSLLKGTHKTSSRIKRLTRCRNQKVDNYLHQASRFLVNTLLLNQITTLVIGKNDKWKDLIDLGKRTNQNFVGVPHCRLIEMISYKCQLAGIKVIIQEESYTSLANFLNLDPMPVYGKVIEQPVFTGKRIKRGLYRTNLGIRCNSDVNGSYNILRKALPKAFSDGIESCVVQPRKINLSKKQ